MGLENLKFWHWMIIGVLLGVGYGYVKSQFPAETQDGVRTRDRGQFQQDLASGAILRKLVLHPAVDGQEWLTGEIYLRPNGSVFQTVRPQPPGGRRWWPRTNAAASQPAAARPLPEGGHWGKLDLLAAQPTRASKDYKTNVTGREYLAWVQKEYGNRPYAEHDVNYRFAWWEVPTYCMAIYGAGGFVVIGVIWPSLIAVMMGAGLVKRPPKDDFDLSKYKPEEVDAAAAKPTVTQQDQDDLAALNAQLEAGVQDMLQTSTTPTIDHAAEHAAVVKKLETRQMDAKEGAIAAPEAPKEYGGEFYPVAKPHGQKSDKPH